MMRSFAIRGRSVSGAVGPCSLLVLDSYYPSSDSIPKSIDWNKVIGYVRVSTGDRALGPEAQGSACARGVRRTASSCAPYLSPPVSIPT